MLTCLVPVLLTFYIQGVLKLKKNHSGAKRLKDASKSVCVQEQCYLLIWSPNPSTSSVICTDPQCPGPSAFLVETSEPAENIAGDLDTHKLAAERDIPVEYKFISYAAQI